VTALLVERRPWSDAPDAFVFRPHPGQWEAWTARERFVAVIAGSGGGKTSMGAAWMLREMAERPGEYLAISPTYPMLTRVLTPALMEIASQYGAQHHKAESRITLRDSVLYLVSADSPERAEGVHASGAWLDEAGQMSGLMWEVIRRRVAHHRGRVLLTTTPYALNWLKFEVFDRWQAGDPEYRVVTFASVANPAYPREEFERARRELPPDRFAMFYLGEFRRASGLVYADWSPATMTVPDEPLPPLWRRVAGLDLGWHNATAAILLAESPDGVVYVEREHYAVETLLADHAAALKEWGEVPIYADPSARQQIEELRGLGLWVEPAQNDVLAGIDAVTRRIRTDRLRAVQGRAPHLLAELESYAWEQKDGKATDRPRKQDDHAVDALRYAVMGLGGADPHAAEGWREAALMFGDVQR
jgi:phage terminase large subunit